MTVLLCLASTASLAAPTALRCEYQTNPIGIDVTAPRLSWQLDDSSRGAKQTAYQVVVADSASDIKRSRGTMWDTGKMDSDQSIHVVYEGQPVVSRGVYHWRVRTWDQDGVASKWSQAATWEMGLLNEDDWAAEWITMDTAEETPTVGQWIWAPERSANQRITLTKSFSATGGVESARIRFTADNRAKVSINGQVVGEHDTWESMAEVDVVSALRAGENTISVEAANEDGPCGFVAGLLVTMDDGSTITVLTDDTWTVGDAGATVVAEYGAQPWGRHEGNDGRSIRLRREVEVEPNVLRARAYVTGLGLYELFINGQRVGEDVFTPGWTHYGKRVQYQTYDVTDLLKPGANAIGAQLGAGWFSGRINKHVTPEGGTN
ncbi:MAG TPA: alpha-L-rhamnosidase N-terminal domain-containing protein, partial [Armatimonadota bacterium]|nr:alpha-L-rhamnosidase N-terminal domain-containing protein [Armatimonadota bacterium]